MLKTFSKYVSQSIMGMIGISVYILADTFFVSLSSGANGLAVLNIILPVYGLIYALGAMIGIGSATDFSLKRASESKTDDCFLKSVMWTLCISSIFIILGIFIPDKILYLMGADYELVKLGTSYQRIVLIGAPFFMTNYTFTAFVRNDEKPTIAMIASISGSVFNIIFDYVFMFPMKMGFTGAALATAMSPIVTMSVCMIHLFSKDSHIDIKWKRFNFKNFFRVCSLGISAFVGEMSGAITTLTFNTLILGLAGNTGVAAYGVIANIALVVMAIFNGVSQGMQPLISYSYGAGKKKETNKYLKMGILTSLSFMVIILVCAFLGTGKIIDIFNHEQNYELYEYAFTGMRLYFLGFIFAALNIVLLTYYAATDRTRISVIGSVLRGLIGIVIWAIILSKLFGINGVWMSFFVSELTTIIVIFIFEKIEKNKQ